jgi:hypothetical protein
MTGESANEACAAGLPPIATPMTVKIPEPITAPIPSAVSDTGPSVFFNACSGFSDSEISLSIDLVRKICLASALAPAYRRIGAGRFNCTCDARTVVIIKPEHCNSQRCSAPARFSLPLALAARGLLDLSLVRATRAGARTLGCCLLACCALYLLALLFIGNALGICHVCQSFCRCDFSELRGAPAGQTSPPASSRRAVEIVL